MKTGPECVNGLRTPADPPRNRDGKGSANGVPNQKTRRSAGSHHHDLPEPLAAPFAAAQPTPIDAEMWPLHSAMWFQPERAPSCSQWSGLAVEHRHRVPAPAFAQPAVAPIDCPREPDLARDPHAPGAQPAMPHSDLAPLGWDPRTVCPKEERE